MTILAFGGEMGFFVPSDANCVESLTAYDSAFARCSTAPSQGSAYGETPHLTAQADMWVHGALLHAATFNNYVTLMTVIEFYDGSGVAFVRLQTSGSAGGGFAATWDMQYLNGVTWTSVGSFSANPTALQDCDFHIVSNTSSGSIDLYLSGTQRVASGTVNLSGHTGVSYAKCWGRTDGIGAAGFFSQMIFATESTIGMRVGTIPMTGQGSTHTFTAGGFAQIDETVYSDADEIHSDTANQVELFTGTPIPSFTSYTIRALGIYARAKKSGSGPAQMQIALRSGGTTYFSATQALGFGYGAIGNVWETNPATGVAFLSSEVPALEYGVKSIT